MLYTLQEANENALAGILYTSLEKSPEIREAWGRGKDNAYVDAENGCRNQSRKGKATANLLNSMPSRAKSRRRNIRPAVIIDNTVGHNVYSGD
jgi:hypothetical protein